MSGRGQVSVEQCPDGPLLVRGADTVRDAAGEEHVVRRPVVAVCVCGCSARAPWCDGTHKVRRVRRAEAQLEADG
ncbi:CDGSH iron-sulfur domain-containing protein [Luteipulveratus halotolerans]|uniref:CDGSH iron-sulfur domain-containing protein n=1 Tax=Luteipulveratus halotolerans TaxID=1631356 RepID=UPI001E4F9829|nr:CDGSH iron-sulfur domain-containing protein [Luteipulveratus halotolerans]